MSIPGCQPCSGGWRRDQVHVASLLDDPQRAGARLELVTEIFEDSTVGRLILNSKVFAADLEREKIWERSQRRRSSPKCAS